MSGLGNQSRRTLSVDGIVVDIGVLQDGSPDIKDMWVQDGKDNWHYCTTTDENFLRLLRAQWGSKQ